MSLSPVSSSLLEACLCRSLKTSSANVSPVISNAHVMAVTSDYSIQLGTFMVWLLFIFSVLFV